MATPQEKSGPARSLADLAASVAAPARAARDVARAISDSPGAAPLHAFVRQGADELAQVLTAFPAHAVQPVSEMGQLFEPTPAEADRQLTGRSLADLREYAARKGTDAAKDMDPPSKDRGQEM